MSARLLLRSVSVALGTAAVVVATAACVEPKACTLLACVEGYEVQFTLRERGAYVFEIDVDGTKTTCRATLPLVPGQAGGCDGPDGAVILSLVGERLPSDQQSIEGLRFTTTTAKQVHVRATRDGAVLADKTFTPAYRTTTGPNGPDCDPPTCTSARDTLL